jgi:ankyrin repeat protein
MPSFNSVSLWNFAWVIAINPELNDYKLLREPRRRRTLQWAASFALDKVCELLIENGADVNQASNFGTQLYSAITWPASTELRPSLLRLDSWDFKLKLNSYASNWWSIVRLLVKAGANAHTTRI